jgi:hypothetical protein
VTAFGTPIKMSSKRNSFPRDITAAVMKTGTVKTVNTRKRMGNIGTKDERRHKWCLLMELLGHAVPGEYKYLAL